MLDFDTENRQKAVSWACQTIAKFAPHLEIRAKDFGVWAIFWRAEGSLPAEPFESDIQDTQNLNWVGLVHFARTCI